MLIKDYIKKHGDTHFKSVLTKEGKQKLSHPNWIITDMRFPNEMEAVVAKGGITIKVVRSFNHKIESKETGTLDLTPLHPSETALDDAKFDYEIDNNSTIEVLIEKVKEILIEQGIL